MNFSGSSSSSASTPASNGSSSNGFSLSPLSSFSSPKDKSTSSSPSASAKASNESSSSEALKAGSLFGVSSFSLYLVSSSRDSSSDTSMILSSSILYPPLFGCSSTNNPVLSVNLFFLIHPLVNYLIFWLTLPNHQKIF